MLHPLLGHATKRPHYDITWHLQFHTPCTSHPGQQSDDIFTVPLDLAQTAGARLAEDILNVTVLIVELVVRRRLPA